MFDGVQGADTRARAGVGLAELQDLLTRLPQPSLATGADGDRDGDADRIDRIAALEHLKAAAAAEQARLTCDLHANQVARDRARDLDPAQTARCVGGQVALARHESPHRGNRHLGLALALTTEMPHTLTALSEGRVSEWQATLMVRATACLSADDRTHVDTELAPQLGQLSDTRLEAAAKAAAARLDPASVAARRRKAENDRRVTVRPAPDTMTHLSGLLPVKDGVACHAALTAAADAARAAGDPRTRAQLMADTLTARVTGRDPAIGVDVEVNLVMPLEAFFGVGSTPGFVPGFGPIPADLAHTWAHPDRPTGPTDTTGPVDAFGAPRREAEHTNANAGATIDGAAAGAGPIDDGTAQRARRFLRRLFATPDSTKLVGMESTRREYSGLLAKFLTLRDQTCRMPTCDAPIRHLDHIQRHTDGGKTTAANGQGACENCNYVKEHPDWHVTSRAGPEAPPLDGKTDTGAWRQTVWTTPTGHRYHSGPPPPVGTGGRTAQPARPPSLIWGACAPRRTRSSD